MNGFRSTACASSICRACWPRRLPRRCSAISALTSSRSRTRRGGDEARTWAPQRQGESPAYVVNNRNKRAIAVDLKRREGCEIVKRLAVRRGRPGGELPHRRDGGVRARLRSARASSIRGSCTARCRRSGEPVLAPARPATKPCCRPSAASCRSPASPDASPFAAACPSSISRPASSARSACSRLCASGATGVGQRVDGSLLETALGLLNYHAESVSADRRGAARARLCASVARAVPKFSLP